MHGIRGKLTYANVMATIAVFIALGGASYAAIKLPKNSVGTKQLKKGAVTPAKLSPAAKSRLVGSIGPAGPTGPKGDPGPRGPSNAYYATNNDESFHAKTISLNVPPGDYVVSASMFAFNREEKKEGRVGCNLISPDDPTHRGSAVANVPEEPAETIISYQQPEAQAVFAIGGSGGTIKFECENAEGKAKVGFYEAQIIATAVGSLTG
jgi:hypothetical protein